MCPRLLNLHFRTIAHIFKFFLTPPPLSSENPVFAPQVLFPKIEWTSLGLPYGPWLAVYKWDRVPNRPSPQRSSLWPFVVLPLFPLSKSSSLYFLFSQIQASSHERTTFHIYLPTNDFDSKRLNAASIWAELKGWITSTRLPRATNAVTRNSGLSSPNLAFSAAPDSSHGFQPT